MSVCKWSSKIAIRCLASLFLGFSLACAASTDFVFTQPQAGSVHYVGDTMLIQFHPSDTSIRLVRDMMGFTNDNGLHWVFLGKPDPLFLNGDDTISTTLHYNWIIPDSIQDSRSTNEVSTAGQFCKLNIAAYETKQTRGSSAAFTILPRGNAARAPGTFAVRIQPTGSATVLVNGIGPASPVAGQMLSSLDGRFRCIVPGNAVMIPRIASGIFVVPMRQATR